MKKILALCLAMLMVLSLTAVLASCNGGKTEETGTKAPETPTQESKTETSTKEPATQESATEESATNPEVPTETDTESATESETPTETDTESATESETPTETDTESATESETPTETDTESATETASETESESESTAPVDPVTGNFKTVISYPWFDFNYANGKQFGFGDGDGLKKIDLIDLHEKGLDCATPNGWTQVFVYYIPSMKMPGGVNSGAKFTANDYMSFGAMRGVADGSYTFGAKMIIANVKGEALSNSLYFAGDADKPQRVKLDDLKDRYVMFVQTFTAEKQSLWVDGKMIYSCKSRYPNQAQMGLTMSAHKYMILNAFVAGETLDENATDLYGKYGIRLMYATGYAYAADEKAIATFFDYYNNSKKLPEPEVKHELSFEDPKTSISFETDFETPSNFQTVLAKKYFEFDFSSKKGLKEVLCVALRDGKDENGNSYWKGKLAGTTLVGLYYIPELNYTNKDFIGLMEYHDYTPGDYDGSLRYNLGEGTVSPLNPEKFLNSVNSVSKKFYVSGWTLFVQTYDATIMKLWCNGELVFIGDASGTRVQTYILGYENGTEVDKYLVTMVINGYAALRTKSENAVDLYEVYGIYMDYAAMYAYGANDNAAKEIYNKFAEKYELKAPKIEQ